jgi:hypothetical protein
MEGQLHISSAGVEHLRSYARKGDKPLLLRLAHFYETEDPESGEVTTFVGPHMIICGEGTIWDQTRNKKMVKIEEMIWAVGIEDLAAIEGRYIDLAYIPSQLGKSSAVVLTVK